MGSEQVRRISPWARCRRAIAPVVTALALASQGPIALAQDARGEPSDADKDAARKLMDQGRAKERAGDKDGALDAYLAADRIMGVPTTGLSVAEAALALGKLVEARDVLRRVSQHPASPSEPAPFARARAQAKELAIQLDRRIPTLTFVITGPAAGAPVTVTVDGAAVPLEAVQFPRAVNPGKREVAASATGYRTLHRTVTVAEGEQATVTLSMEPEQAEQASESGGLTLEGTSPLVWVGLSLTVVGLGLGITTGALALSKSSELESACPHYGCPPSRKSDIDSMTALSHVSTVSFAVAGAGLVLGVVGLALSDWSGAPPAGEPASNAPAVRMLAGPGALMLRGRF